MNIVACRDREQSLNAMWRAYLAVTVLTDPNNTEKSPAIVGHAFLNARYYDLQRGQFLSEDPMFLTIGDTANTQRLTRRSQDSFLADPQQLNSYNYGRNNPITIKDSDGLFIPEALVGAGIGGVVGVGIQAVTDLATWNLSSRESYAGAFTGGATFGGLVGATDGLSLIPIIFAGGVSGAVQSGTTQGLSLYDGRQTSFSYGDLGTNVLLSGGTAWIPGLKMAGVTAERGSFLAVQKQVYTKLSNNTISPLSVSLATYGKMTVSTAAQQAPGAAVQGALSSIAGVLKQISSILGSIKSSNNKSSN